MNGIVAFLLSFLLGIVGAVLSVPLFGRIDDELPC